MSIATITPQALPMPPEPVRQFSVDEYHQMIQAGILTEDDDVELLEGWIVPKMARKPEHDALISVLQVEVLGPRLPVGWFCRGQSAITTRESEPEPDVAVARGRPRDYLDHHPSPLDMALVIEVAESSLPRDRGWKARIYARANVPVYWIVNLIDGQIEVYTDPTGPCSAPEYRQRQDYRGSDAVPLVIDGRDLGTVSASELLP